MKFFHPDEQDSVWLSSDFLLVSPQIIPYNKQDTNTTKRNVWLSDAKMFVTSEEGKGSCFTVKLKRADDGTN